jgi:hypothetical protein
MINFYRWFLRAIARALAPLTDALRGGGKGATPIEWTTEMQTAFEQAKERLCSAARLCHPDINADLSITVDASDTHVGQFYSRGARTTWPGGL